MGTDEIEELGSPKRLKLKKKIWNTGSYRLLIKRDSQDLEYLPEIFDIMDLKSMGSKFESGEGKGRG